jgi:hypothetical protein
MHSKVVKKARPAKMSQYSKSAMNNPIKAMKEEGKSIRVLGITLQDQVTDVRSPQHGCPTHPIEECLLVKHIALLADGGFPLRQMDVTEFVKSYVEKPGITHKFKSNQSTVRYVDSML